MLTNDEKRLDNEKKIRLVNFSKVIKDLKEKLS